MGRSIINWGGVTDNQLDGNSDHPLTNRAATAEFLRYQNLMNEKELNLNNSINQTRSMVATTYSRGMTQLTTSGTVTDPNLYALSAVEKNAGINGTLAQQIAVTNASLADLRYAVNNRVIHRVVSTDSTLPITAAYTDHILVTTTDLPEGLYVVYGQSYVSDTDINTHTAIYVDQQLIRRSTNRVLGFVGFDGVTAIVYLHPYQTVRLILQVNYLNPGKVCSGTLDCLRVA